MLRELIRSIIKESNQSVSRKKYPRTFHLPWSESKTEDDKTLSPQQVEKMFVGKQVVVTEKLDGEAEGYVIRTESGFPMSNFGRHAAKFVRKGHVQTKDHWMHTKIVPNRLKER